MPRLSLRHVRLFVVLATGSVLLGALLTRFPTAWGQLLAPPLTLGGIGCAALALSALLLTLLTAPADGPEVDALWHQALFPNPLQSGALAVGEPPERATSTRLPQS